MEQQKNPIKDEIDSTEPQTTQPAETQDLNFFKTSSIPQPEPLKKYLQNLLTGDPYNKFCVDCHQKLSTHACLAYGIFVCQDCANVHIQTFEGRSRSQIKEVLTEWWDDYQLEAVAPGVGGNKSFYQYLQEYEGLAQFPIDKKYKSDQVIWYMKKLAAHLDQRPFTELQPAKDWDERFERAKASMKNLISKGDKKTTVQHQIIQSQEEVKGGQQETQQQQQQEIKEKQIEEVKAQEPSKVKEFTSKLKGFFKFSSKSSQQQPEPQPQLQSQPQPQPQPPQPAEPQSQDQPNQPSGNNTEEQEKPSESPQKSEVQGVQGQEASDNKAPQDQ